MGEGFLIIKKNPKKQKTRLNDVRFFLLEPLICLISKGNVVKTICYTHHSMKLTFLV